MSLKKYQAKRDFKKTSEPEGEICATESNLFVIQKHAASHLHYDFRLELNGVLLSWAVPKGPCLDASVKRLAMHVEDHPVEYGHFEGIIPKGEYGGGTVMVWDIGTWEPLDKNPQKSYKKGHLSFNLHAKKLHGQWSLIRFKDEKHWLLVKHNDEFARNLFEYDITAELPNSVLSNQSIDEIAEHHEKIGKNKAVTITPPQKKKKAVRKSIIQLPPGLNVTSMVDFLSPQLATLVDKPPVGDQWVHEIKFDGYRILSFIKNNQITLKSRNNKNWTKELLPIAEALKILSIKNAIFDGEVVLLNKEGKSDFQLLQNTIKSTIANAPFIYYIFDLLYYDKYDLTGLSLIERKTILQKLLGENSATLRYSEHFKIAGDEIFHSSCELALEGIISKDKQSCYVARRSKRWLKIKCLKRQEFVIGAYSSPKGERSHFGALYLGVFNEQGTLDYTGNVGTGFSQKSLKEVYQALKKHEISYNPFNSKPPAAATAHWVNPVLVAEVEFSEWTADGHLRHPSFKGLRLDKKAARVIREYEKPVTDIELKSKLDEEVVIKLTHPDKILYPEDKITKHDILTYYEIVADYMLPYIKNRPLSLVRCPADYKKCFFQRHYNQMTPKTLHPVEIINNQHKHEQYLYLNNKAGLFSLVQMGVLEIHPWGSLITQLEKPDIIIIDLDPAPDVVWKEIVAAAFEIKSHLEDYKLTSFVKSTGGKGLHLVIPIKPEYEWDEVKNFTHVFVQFLEKLRPEHYISTMSKAKRVGKIFVDYLRNQRGATAIGTYSMRSRIHAPVSVPLSWDELTNDRRATSFTIKTLPARLEELKQDPWEKFWTISQSLRLNQFE